MILDRSACRQALAAPWISILLLLCPAVPSLASDEAAAAGLVIAIEADKRDTGFGDSTADLNMLLNIATSEQVTRAMRQRILEVTGDGDKSILVFDRPRDLNGTAILTFTHKQGNDDQWLYLPALKRVKRISSADKSGPFMGSEFAYEDLASQEVEKYTYKYLSDKKHGDLDCYELERVPVDTRSGYSRQVVLFDKNEYRLQQVDYYDRKGDLLKTMELSGYRQYLDTFWRPDQMLMTNHQTGNSTVLAFSNYQFKVGLTDKDFSRDALARIR